jgi:hypothetical protein
MKKKKEDFLMGYLYVDDLIYAGTSKNIVAEFKNVIMKEFKTISRENFYFIRKVCYRSFQEIQLVRMYTSSIFHGSKREVTKE